MALQRFADYAAGLTVTDLPEDAIHAAKRAVIDWFASTLRGGLEAPATLLTEAFSDSAGKALLYPSGHTTDPRTAALINGAASHTIEFDDIYRDGLYHPGAPVISAVLALAPAKGLGGVIDPQLALQAGLDYLAGHRMGDLLDASQRATAAALTQNKRPVRIITIDILDETVMGALMMHFMAETVIAARLLGVNAFDQPAVEAGKLRARRSLEEDQP